MVNEFVVSDFDEILKDLLQISSIKALITFKNKSQLFLYRIFDDLVNLAPPLISEEEESTENVADSSFASGLYCDLLTNNEGDTNWIYRSDQFQNMNYFIDINWLSDLCPFKAKSVAKWTFTIITIHVHCSSEFIGSTPGTDF